MTFILKNTNPKSSRQGYRLVRAPFESLFTGFGIAIRSNSWSTHRDKSWFGREGWLW